MTNYAATLFVAAQAVLVRVEAMKAENAACQFQNVELTYREDRFYQAANELEIIRRELLNAPSQD